MGDMADYLYECIEDLECGVYESDGYDEPEWEPRSPIVKTCRCCGKTGLTWGTIDGKWRLFEDTKEHQCPVKPLNRF